MAYFEHGHKTRWRTKLPETGLGSFPVSLMPTQACQGISSPTWVLPTAANQEGAEQTQSQRQEGQDSHANPSKSIINSWFHRTVWLGEVLFEGEMEEEEEQMRLQSPSEPWLWCSSLYIATLVGIFNQCRRRHMHWWTATLNPSWTQGRFLTNTWKAISMVLLLSKFSPIWGPDFLWPNLSCKSQLEPWSKPHN